MCALEPEVPVTLSTRRVYSGNRISLRVDTIRLDGRPEVEREIVEHPGSIVLVPVTNRGTVVMIRQWRQAAGEVVLELPAGTLEPGEEPVTTAQRELREETGYRAESLIDLGGAWVSPGYTTEFSYAYLATGLIVDPLPQDHGEDIRTVEIPIDEVHGLIRSGDLRDQMTIAALYAALEVHRDQLEGSGLTAGAG